MPNKAIKYRIYPTKEQQVFFAKTFGCCRKIWNLMLDTRETAYKTSKTTVHPTPAQYKKEYPFLAEVDSLALCNVQQNLEKAYSNFFKNNGAGHPKFKSKKHSKNSYTTNNQKNEIRIDPEAGTIRLPKIETVKAEIHRLPPDGWKLKSATISMSSDGKYYCSVLFEYEEQTIQKHSLDSNAVGLDYKSDGLYVSSNGEVCGSPKYFRKSQTRLTKAQRKLRHKQKDSNNYQKASKKIAKVHVHIANQRKDYLHKKTNEIANQYDLVCVETLDLRAMSNKHFGLGKSTMDNGFGMMVTMLDYKLQDLGKALIRVDKYYPSSQLCSCCGYKNPEVKDLKIRQWTCPKCGAEHDRDLNAAINIRNEGIRLYLAV